MPDVHSIRRYCESPSPILSLFSISMVRFWQEPNNIEIRVVRVMRHALKKIIIIGSKGAPLGVNKVKNTNRGHHF